MGKKEEIEMTRLILLGAISELSTDEQAKMQAALEQMRAIWREYGDIAGVAMALLALEMGKKL